MAEIPFNQLNLHLDDVISDVIRDVAFRTLSAVTVATPVGNPALWQNPGGAPPGYVGGRARGNWQVGIGSEQTNETGTIDPSGSITISQARSNLAGYRIGPRIIINNNVPYIARLNQGHSTQAPVMFVERGIQTAIASFNARGNVG